MTLTPDLAPALEGALVNAARRQGQTPEEAAAALRSVSSNGPATLPAENGLEDGDHADFTNFLLHASAEATQAYLEHT